VGVDIASLPSPQRYHIQTTSPGTSMNSQLTQEAPLTHPHDLNMLLLPTNSISDHSHHYSQPSSSGSLSPQLAPPLSLGGTSLIWISKPGAFISPIQSGLTHRNPIRSQTQACRLAGPVRKLKCASSPKLSIASFEFAVRTLSPRN